MIEISVRFLTGRYHATPWGRHVNEGAVEWPPSPWRMLRALVAAWRRTLPGLRQDQVEPILRALATAPEFLLPQAATGHTRHFMPWFKKGPDDRTLVFDTFVAVPRDSEVIARWPDTALDHEERETLSRILANLSSFGRSESWCEATLRDGYEQRSSRSAVLRCCPLTGRGLADDHEIVRLLCPDPRSAFGDHHVVEIKQRTTGRGRNRQTVEERVTMYDPAWNLCMETLQLHREKWSDPPGSCWVSYARPRHCFRIENRPRPHPLAGSARVQFVRFALDSTVLPLVTETLPVAETTRRALIRLYTDVRGLAEYGQDWSRDRHRAGEQPVPLSRVLSGKDDFGQPLRGNRHAYYLPTDEDGDGRLDHLTVYASDGFGPYELGAFDRLRELKTESPAEESHPLRVLLLGMGTCGGHDSGPLRASCGWVSATPYVAARYPKTRGRSRIDMGSRDDVKEFLEADLRAQLAVVRPEFAVERASAVMIEPLWDENLVFRIARRWRPIQFKRFRRKRGDDGGRRLAGTFRITFPEPVRGPLVFGHSSHFGLGLFLPCGPSMEPASPACA